MIKIEKGIPMPKLKNEKGGFIEALKSMKVGDSFIDPHKSVSNVHVYARMAGIKIATRTMPDKTKRVWRVK